MSALRMPQNPKLTVEEYLALQDVSEEKWEFFMGEIFAMAGAMPDHNRIAVNAISGLNTLLKDSDCEVFNSDQRLHVVPINVFAFPDVSVYCERPELSKKRKDTFINPTLLLEVVSPATEDYDRGKKFARYRFLPSLQEYLLIASDEVNIELHRKKSMVHWEMMEYRSLDDVIALSSLGISLSVAELYRNVDFLNPNT